jgi:16S rRNA (guanine527-N7)-methyltransferase
LIQTGEAPDTDRGPPHQMTPQDFQKATNVSRETLSRLQVYADLLVKWQKAINLVSKSTLPDLWQRHMLDSAQLFDIADTIYKERQGDVPSPAESSWLDLGSGAGFPGLVLAIMGVPRMQLVESDARKCTFMREVARATNVDVTIHTSRIEKLSGSEVVTADYISARALAKVDQLLDWATPFSQKNTIFLFPKGQEVDPELQKLLKSDNSFVKKWPSRTHPDSVVLQIERRPVK